MNVCMKISTKVKLCQVIICNGVQVLVIFTEALILYLNRRIIGHVKKYQIHFQTNLANRPGLNLALQKWFFPTKITARLIVKFADLLGG